MQNYEIMLVVQGQIPEDLAKEVINKVKSFIKELGGEEKEEDFWGRRKLAYNIGNQEHGYYDVLNFSLEPENVKKLENEIKLISEIIRFLLIKKEEKIPQENIQEKGKSLKEKKEKVSGEKRVQPVKEKKEKEAKKIEKSIEETKDEKERLKELDKKIDEILKE